MKKRISSLVSVAALAGFVLSAQAGDYKTVIVPAGGETAVNVASDGFMLLRNYTQEGGSTRGLIKVDIRDQSATVMSATLVDNNVDLLAEPINSIIIAGPATVTATCPADASSCVLTYRKNSGQD